MFRVQQLRGPHFGPFDLHLDSGEIACVFGPSGVGKSQLLRAMADLDPHDGEVALDGRAQESFSPPAWRRLVAYLPAESGWWSARVGDHFNEPPMPDDLESLGLGVSILGREVDQISSGERQRLGLLRLLAQRPRLLLLDEPTANLDPESALKLEHCVRAYLEETGAAAIVVTHDPAQRQRLADHIIELSPRVSP